MGENFMTAGTQIENLLEMKKEMFNKAANLIVEATVNRSVSGVVSMGTKKDIMNILKEFTNEEKVEILSTAFVILAMNGRFNISPTNKKKESGGERRSKKIHKLTNIPVEDDDLFGFDLFL